jgi:hypothetical protein
MVSYFTTFELCGRPRPAIYECRHWPRICCLLPLGHENDHECDRGDGIVFSWPWQPGDAEALMERLDKVVR